eukprot:9453123-Pyramimonas_sp.AAC.1
MTDGPACGVQVAARAVPGGEALGRRRDPERVRREPITEDHHREEHLPRTPRQACLRSARRSRREQGDTHAHTHARTHSLTHSLSKLTRSVNQ